MKFGTKDYFFASVDNVADVDIEAVKFYGTQHLASYDKTPSNTIEDSTKLMLLEGASSNFL